MQKIQQLLHQWYNENKRDLPWRYTHDAYKIWISEIMLQQTQVAQGLPYYVRFLERFPCVQDLANAEESEVLKLWQGLGYYSRARNLHAASKQVVNDFNGIFPTQYDDLITLKGVGDYSASAVSSFSIGEVRACVDGNVIRVVSRLFGMDLPYDTAVGKKAIRAFADELLDKNNSPIHNQAIMEFGALQCVPKNPRCGNCPLLSECVSFANGNVLELPVKSKKTKVQNLFLYYFVFFNKNQTLIQQRQGSGIWKNLYEFPVLESATEMQEKEVLKYVSDVLDARVEKGNAEIRFSSVYNHILSHRKIQATFIQVTSDLALPVIKDTHTILVSEMDNFPVSRLIERFWEDFTDTGDNCE